MHPAYKKQRPSHGNHGAFSVGSSLVDKMSDAPDFAQEKPRAEKKSSLIGNPKDRNTVSPSDKLFQRIFLLLLALVCMCLLMAMLVWWRLLA